MIVVDERDAFAIGYYHGRAIGNDEQGRAEIGESWPRLGHAFKEGYDAGVADYVAGEPEPVLPEPQDDDEFARRYGLL